VNQSANGVTQNNPNILAEEHILLAREESGAKSGSKEPRYRTARKVSSPLGGREAPPPALIIGLTHLCLFACYQLFCLCPFHLHLYFLETLENLHSPVKCNSLALPRFWLSCCCRWQFGIFKKIYFNNFVVGLFKLDFN